MLVYYMYKIRQLLHSSLFNYKIQRTNVFNPLKTKRRLLYLQTQSVPRCKHFSSWLQKPISLCFKWHKSLFVLR